MKGRVYWRVPSATSPELDYLVVYYPNGETECRCPAYTDGKGHYPCWHSLLVVSLQSQSAYKMGPRKLVQAARDGDPAAQLKLMGSRAAFLVHISPLAAQLATRTAASYVQALVHRSDTAQAAFTAIRVSRDRARRPLRNKWRWAGGRW
ncbi:MAG: hypothetical protein ABI670_19630 [Chloroflexota bacterium]